MFSTQFYFAFLCAIICSCLQDFWIEQIISYLYYIMHDQSCTLTAAANINQIYCFNNNFFLQRHTSEFIAYGKNLF